MRTQWFYDSSVQRFYGLSTDTKPTGCTNGSVFIEIDTGDKYLYNEAGAVWVLIPNTSAASNVEFTPPSDMNSTTVQDAIVEVDSKVESLPDPMIFKGSLGVNGTITSLPNASTDNNGFVYKVITDGTYQGVSAEAGDTFISNGTEWILIPSGDEPSGTVTNVAVTSDDGSATITGSPVATSGTIDVSVVVDASFVQDSNHPVKSKLLQTLFTPMTQAQYDSLQTKDMPLYFIYET